SFGPVLAYGNEHYFVAWDGDASGWGAPRSVLGQMMVRQDARSIALPVVNHHPNSKVKMKHRGTPATSPWLVEGMLGRLNRIWAFDESNFYAVGEDGVYQYDGSSWQFLFAGPHGREFGLWGNGPNDLWVTGWCWDVDHWTPGSNTDLSCQDSGIGMAVWGS